MPTAPEQHTAETLTIEGADALKSIAVKDGTAIVGAYAIRFANSAEKDLAGEYFTTATKFGPTNGDGATTLFNHGIPIGNGPIFAELAEREFGSVKARRDEVGIFVETCLNLHDRHEAAVADLCAKGKLKWSSGSASHLVRKSADGEITRWHPIEFSFTPTPCEPRLPAIRPLKSVSADVSADIAGAFVDRPGADDPQLTAKSSPTISFPTMTPEQLAAQNAAQDLAVKSRVSEVNEILAIGNRYKLADAAQAFIKDGKGVNEFKSYVLENAPSVQPVVTQPIVGMGKRDVKSWSFLKAIREIANGGGVHALTGVEKEASEATAGAIKMTPKGFFIPHDIATANLAEANDLGSQAIKALIEQAAAIKNLNATTFTAGGALVGTNLLTGSMIELLRNKPLVSQMGARTMSGLVGNVAIPRLNGGATTYWLSEQGTLTASDQTFGQLGLTPKKLGARTGYTKELMHQSDLSVEAIVRNDLTTILALAKDVAAINGSGVGQPLGILNQPTGLNSVTFGATATRQKMTDFQKEVAVDNASRGALAYLTTPTVAGKLMNVAEAPNFPKFIWDGNIDSGSIVGRSAFSTNQVPGDKVIYGNWNDLIIADWAGLDVVVDPYTQAAQGVIVINITLMTDIGVRHVVSFCVSTDSGAQ